MNKPSNYGRQASTQTIRSVSLDIDVATWLQQQAIKENRSASSFVNELLKKRRAAATSKKSLNR